MTVRQRSMDSLAGAVDRVDARAEAAITEVKRMREESTTEERLLSLEAKVADLDLRVRVLENLPRLP